MITVLENQGTFSLQQSVLSGNVATFTVGSTTGLMDGFNLLLAGLTNLSFLNGLSLPVQNITSTTFDVAYTHAPVSGAAETGTAQSLNWAKELLTGNAAFVEASGIIYVVSNVRADNTFVVLKSNPAPPDPGPGATFSVAATYTFTGTQIDFDPAIAYDSVAGVIHIVGCRTNPSNPVLADILKFTFTIAGSILSGPVVLATGSRVRDAYDVVGLAAGHSIVGVCVDEPISYLDGTVTPGIGTNLVVMELDNTDAVVPNTTVELLTSPPRSGDTFSSISMISPDGILVELYNESHPKLVTFADQVFKIRVFNRDNTSTWDAGTDLTTFQARYTDDRLTVVPFGTTRFMTQTFYNLPSHPLGLVGNLLMGYLNPPNPWDFHTVFGSVAGGSIVQGTPSIDIAGAMNVVYLLEPFNSPADAWPLHAATVDQNLIFTEVPGFYNNQLFTWLRGSKDVIDNTSVWAVVGEQVRATSPSPLPVYLSLFNVPPVAGVTPTSATVYRGGAGYDIGAGLVVGDLPLAATATDADSNPLRYFWSVNDVDLTDVVLTPNGANATLDVSRKVGGGSRTFTIGLAVVDYQAGLVTPIHPPLVVTNVDVTANVLTVTANNGLVATETVLLYGLAVGSPAAPTVSQNPGGTLPSRTYYVQVTYVNSTGESTSSAETTFAVSANNLAHVTSPAAAGDATAYNVYAWDTSGNEALQTTTPIPLGTDWDEDTIGLHSGLPVPLVNTCYLQAEFNDRVVTVATASPTQFTVNSWPTATFPSTAVVGFAIPQFQYATSAITVPSNAAPTITPQPQFGDAAITNISLTSNVVTVTANNAFTAGQVVVIKDLVTATFLNDVQLTVLASGLSGTQFEANFTHADYPSAADTGVAHASVARDISFTFTPTITGANDIDDATTYTWLQTGGNPILATNGLNAPTLSFVTRGFDVHGETLTFQLTVDDGVNTPVVDTTFTITIQAYSFSGLDTLFLARSNFTTDGTTIATIAERNIGTGQWTPLMISAILTDLNAVKRTSVLDGSDRYLTITPFGITVYGGVTPLLFVLRHLLTPDGAEIIDAVHTEQDYTLVLTANNFLYRYSTAPLINTDNPDTVIDMLTISAFSFNRIFVTPSFANLRMIVLSGPDGVLLMQVKTDTLQVKATFELSVENGFIYGVDNVQFVRTNSLESMRQGKVLIGTIQPFTATITNLRVLDNTAIVTAANNFTVGTKVIFSGITNIPDLNGRELVVTLANATGFQCSVLHPDAGTGPSYTDTGLATATNAGITYETLVDLSQGQIVGTWDASRIRNQRVESGEIMFEPESTYTGAPPAPANVTATALGGGNVRIAWQQERPDLVYAYDVNFSVDGGSTYSILQRVNSGVTQSITVPLTPSVTYFFQVQAFSQDGISPLSAPANVVA